MQLYRKSMPGISYTFTNMHIHFIQYLLQSSYYIIIKYTGIKQATFKTSLTLTKTNTQQWFNSILFESIEKGIYFNTLSYDYKTANIIYYLFNMTSYLLIISARGFPCIMPCYKTEYIYNQFITIMNLEFQLTFECSLLYITVKYTLPLWSKLKV